MAAAVARHDAIIETLVGEYGGSIVRPRGEGDSRFAVFASAAAAVAAACAIQRSLAREDWPTTGPLRVRIGLHTGEAEFRAGDYYGTSVNRCARLRDIGHGGQILLSSKTRQLVDGAPAGWPDRVQERYLGEFHLSGLSQTEHVYQLVFEDLPNDFPQLRTPMLHTGNLPIPATSFVGRRSELGYVSTLIEDRSARLVTLTGPGGVGKTRLAVQFALDAVNHFRDGAFLVSLAAVTDHTRVARAIAEVLGVAEARDRSVVDQLADFLRDRDCLLILDNFEHVVSAAPLVADLLAATARLKILVTSRVVLHLAGERQFAVEPFTHVSPPNLTVTAASPDSDAVRLFVERAQAVTDFAPGREDLAKVAAICSRLDGLPLAIELVAAKSRVLTPGSLDDELARRRLDIVSGGPRDAPARHRTLQTAIGWSYDLLGPSEQAIFRQLAVFSGGFSVAAAAAVSEIGGGLVDHIGAIETLVYGSLVDAHRQAAGDMRFTMLETIREFALDLLDQSPEREVVRLRHARYFYELAATEAPRLRGPDRAVALAKLELDYDNIRGAMEWAHRSGEVTYGLRTAAAMGPYWQARAHLEEGQSWLSRLLNVPHAGEQKEVLAARASALAAEGSLARLHDDYELATTSLQEALALYRQLADFEGTAAALLGLANVGMERADFSTAAALYEQALELFRRLSDNRGAATVLNNLGRALMHMNEFERSSVLHEESLRLRRSIGDSKGVAMSLSNLAYLARLLDDLPRAVSLQEESLTIRREVGEQLDIGVSLSELAALTSALGDSDRASQFLAESLRIYHAAGHRQGVATCLERASSLLANWNYELLAAEVLAVADQLRESIHVVLAPSQRAEFERHTEHIRSRLDQRAFALAWDRGRLADPRSVAEMVLALLESGRT
jgi:predicted ATPase